VDKLRGLLARRGVTSTAAALSVALANQAIVAAPAGLAASITGAAVAGAGTAAVTFMSLTKLQLGLASAVLVTGAGIYAVQKQTNAALRDELAAIPQSSSEVASLRQSNRELARVASEAANPQTSDAELVRLRDEAVALQRQFQAAVPPVAQSPARARADMFTGPTLSIGELDKKPIATRRRAPAYPYELSAAGINGTVVVSFVIDATGKARDVHAVASTHHDFETAAVAAVTDWQFDPGLKDGRAVNTRVSQLLEFNADPDSAPARDWF